MIFIFFILINEDLNAIDEILKITKREDAIIILSNNFTVKLCDVLMMSDTKINLLFIQTLRIQSEIISQQKLHVYKFYKNSKLIMKDTHHEKVSYLIWMWESETLYKLIKETVYLVADRIVSVKTLHQRLDYSEKRRLIQMKNTVKNLKIINMKDLLNLKNCRICMKIKKMKLQQHLTVTWAD